MSTPIATMAEKGAVKGWSEDFSLEEDSGDEVRSPGLSRSVREVEGRRSVIAEVAVTMGLIGDLIWDDVYILVAKESVN